MKFAQPEKYKRTKRHRTGDKIILENVRIMGKDCRVDIINKSGAFSITFLQAEHHRDSIYNDIYDEGDVGYDYDFGMSITKDGKIRFYRHYYRNHDHDDVDILQTETDEEGKPIGRPFWSKRGPYKNEKCDYFEIDFGALSDFR